jgi:hypothetical protein
VSYSDYSFKFAKTILQQHFQEQYEDILLAVGALNTPLGRGVRPTPAETLAELLHQRGWQREQPVTPNHTYLRLSKVQRDLEVYRSMLACPVWVIGLKEGQ